MPTVTPSPKAAPTAAPNVENNTFMFLLGWLVMIVILVGVNRTHVGHVIIYYSLLLIILVILATEYQQIVPIFNSVTSIGQFNVAQGVGATTQGVK